MLYSTTVLLHNIELFLREYSSYCVSLSYEGKEMKRFTGYRLQIFAASSFLESIINGLIFTANFARVEVGLV